ncbi:glycosyl hydrolases family 31-domain-containing protein [Sporodiniella umbellata]|nr:glycosyl hydrolases family 31-domain-containing protein [Sporodiniella umbellata]
MWNSVIKNLGLSSTEEYIKPRLSIGKAVAHQEFSTGHFKIKVDPEALALIVKNGNDRVIWKSIQNQPFIFSNLGVDEIICENNGVFKVTEKSEQPTRIQTITKIEKADKDTIKIYGGLGPKFVLPTHMDYVLVFKELTHRQLQFSVEITQKDSRMQDYNRLILMYESRPEEHFYGFGEQFSFVSLKGQKVPILVREQGEGSGAQPTSSLKDSALSIIGGSSTDTFATYASIPQYITSDMRCLFMENSEYMSFDLTESDRVSIRVDSSSLKGRILDGKTMLDLLEDYTSFTGRMTPLPDWTSDGIVVGIQGGKDKVKDVMKQLKKHHIPVTAVCIEDWTGGRAQVASRGTQYSRQWWNWESDGIQYPNWDDFVRTLTNDEGVRVLSYVNPCLSDVSGKGGFKKNLFADAQTKGYLVKSTQSSSSEATALSLKFGMGLEAGLLDLTNPEARNWFKQVLKEQVWNTGVSGMMVDFGEHLPYDPKSVLLHSNESVSNYHNHYSEEWALLHYELVRELQYEKEALCFFRSGYINSPKYMSLFWAGRQNVAWDQHHGIKSAVTGMISSGFSGFSVTHCDVGGYNTVVSNLPGLKMWRTKELLFRWMELGAFTAVYRTSEGITPASNSQFYDNEETYSHLAHTAKLFMLVTEYRKKALKEAYEKGWPLMRHPVLYYPSDRVVRELTYQQFMLGSSIMVAPVLNPSASYVKVYFPKDSQGISWRHIWSGKYYPGDGAYKAVDSPLGQPPVFIKEPRDDDGLLNDLLNYATTYYQRKIATNK